jgi:hypothetical protein
VNRRIPVDLLIVTASIVIGKLLVKGPYLLQETSWTSNLGRRAFLVLTDSFAFKGSCGCSVTVADLGYFGPWA